MQGSGPLTLYCATSNAGKLREFRQAAGGSIEVQGLPALDCPEDGDTFEHNAVSKALCYSRAAMPDTALAGERPLYLFADDSGIEVDALGGAPGVHSARFSGPGATAASNNAMLVEKLRGVPSGDRGARFVCVIALTLDGTLLSTFHGEVEGRILEAPVGSRGFGYDPLFFYPPLSCSFAELAGESKWTHSHRGRAFRQLLEWIGANPPEARKR
jgi:XTP/dITP diphosphohydrolase